MAIKNRGRLKANDIGFYPLKGDAVIKFGKGSKDETFIEFLKVLREKNPYYKILVLDFGQIQNRSQQKGEEGSQEAWYQVVLFASLLSWVKSHRVHMEDHKEHYLPYFL